MIKVKVEMVAVEPKNEIIREEFWVSDNTTKEDIQKMADELLEEAALTSVIKYYSVTEVHAS